MKSEKKKAPGALYIIMPSFYPLFEAVCAVSRHSADSFFIVSIDSGFHILIVFPDMVKQLVP